MTGLRTFIEEQQAAGLVERVSQELDPEGEAGQLLARKGGKIVILENLKGYKTGVVSGLGGSRQLLAAALKVSPSALVQTLADRMDEREPIHLVDGAPFMDSSIEAPQVDGIVPLLTFDPGSRAPYTSASIIAARSEHHGMNLSFHRMRYLGGSRFAVRIVPRHLSMILRSQGGRAKVAVLFGVHPAVSLAAATSSGPDFDELAMASALMGGLDVVDLDGLIVPAHTELVLLGEITDEMAEEGPFVDLTGTLDGVRSQPVLTITALYHRPDFLYQVIVPGEVEHRLLMGMPQEPRMLRAVANAFPGVKAVALSAGGCNWLHAVVALDSPKAGQARNAALAALGAHPSLKRVVVVDSDIDVHDAEAVEWAIATRVQADRDIIIIPGARGSSLDPSRRIEDATTAKWIIDATVPADAERSEFVRAKPAKVWGAKP